MVELIRTARGGTGRPGRRVASAGDSEERGDSGGRGPLPRERDAGAEGST
jgi:hypothetical protein